MDFNKESLEKFRTDRFAFLDQLGIVRNYPTIYDELLYNWQLFCQKPQNIKDTFTFIEPGQKKPDLGYILRNNPEIEKDVKQILHYTFGLENMVAERGNVITDEVGVIFRLCNVLLSHSLARAFSILEIIKKYYGINPFDDSELIETSRVRLVQYDDMERLILAESHPDRSVFTFLLYSSHDGLCGAAIDDLDPSLSREDHQKFVKSQMKLIRRPLQTEMIFFGGQTLEFLTDGIFRPFVHMVKNHNQGDARKRLAIAVFISLRTELPEKYRYIRELFELY